VPEAEYYTPALTTVRQNFLAVGRAAFDLLLREMSRGARSTERVAIQPELVVRASTAGPRAPG
jgi:DNA-binding LacI/PurR family transcriptional regulator